MLRCKRFRFVPQNVLLGQAGSSGRRPPSLLTRSYQSRYRHDLKIVFGAVTCGNGAPGGIRTPNLLIQSLMVP
jgi:hypothetical protein